MSRYKNDRRATVIACTWQPPPCVCQRRVCPGCELKLLECSTCFLPFCDPADGPVEGCLKLCQGQPDCGKVRLVFSDASRCALCDVLRAVHFCVVRSCVVCCVMCAVCCVLFAMCFVRCVCYGYVLRVVWCVLSVVRCVRQRQRQRLSLRLRAMYGVL